jgi:hypothetical protein
MVRVSLGAKLNVWMGSLNLTACQSRRTSANPLDYRTLQFRPEFAGWAAREVRSCSLRDDFGVGVQLALWRARSAALE